MDNYINPYSLTTANYSNSGSNANYTGYTTTGYNAPTHISTT